MCMRGIAAQLGSWPNAEDARWYLYFGKYDSSGGLRVTLSDPFETGTEKPSSQNPSAWRYNLSAMQHRALIACYVMVPHEGCAASRNPSMPIVRTNSAQDAPSDCLQ